MNDHVTLQLPADLAPMLADRVRLLLDEVSVTTAPPLVIDLVYSGPRCVVCHQGGKLGGHHDDDGRVRWIHRSCHRRLHRRGRPRTVSSERHRHVERRHQVAC
jgi:hypothetical protein